MKGLAESSTPGMQQSFAASLEVLGRIGTIEELELPDRPYDPIMRIILQAEAASALEDLVEDGVIAGLTAPEDRYLSYARDAILAKDYVKAVRLRGVVAREVDGVLAGFDALLAPGRPAVASGLDQEFRPALGSTPRDLIGAVGNLAGLPAVIVPNGVGERGLPTSLQLVGRAYEENSILAAARAYQALTDWHRRHPPVG